MNKKFSTCIFGGAILVIITVIIMSLSDGLQAAEGDRFTVKQVWFYDYRHVTYFPISVGNKRLYCYNTPTVMFCRERHYPHPENSLEFQL